MGLYQSEKDTETIRWTKLTESGLLSESSTWSSRYDDVSIDLSNYKKLGLLLTMGGSNELTNASEKWIEYDLDTVFSVAVSSSRALYNDMLATMGKGNVKVSGSAYFVSGNVRTITRLALAGMTDDPSGRNTKMIVFGGK